MSTLPYSLMEQRAALAEVARFWEEVVTRAGMRHLMRPPIFALHTNRNWGTWHPQRRELSLHARLAIDLQGHEDWEETIAHEVAHQWVDEVVRAREAPHGPMWRRGARLFGAHPKATACCQLETLCAPPSDADDRVIRRVQRLLALSDSANPHEAELAALNARKLIAKHQLDEAQATGQAAQRWAYKTLGEPVARRPQWLQLLACILQDHFHVQGIWLRYPSMGWDGPAPSPGTSQTLLEITGTPASVAIAAHVYAFLRAESQRRLADYVAAASRPPSRSARLDFLDGFFAGFRKRLDAQRDQLESQWRASAEGALVPLAEAALSAFHESRYPRVRRTHTSRGLSDAGAYAEGQAHREQTRLHHAVSRAETSVGGGALPR